MALRQHQQQRLLALLLQCARRSVLACQQQQQQRTGAVAGRAAFSTDASGGGEAALDDAFVALSTTPVTRALWAQRLARADSSGGGDSASAPAPAAASADPPAPRPPAPQVVRWGWTQDAALRAMYSNPWQRPRVGRILEDIDSIAGSVAFEHCHTPGAPPPHLVTVAVDAINLHQPLTLERDACATGQVVFTGGSSLDIRIDIRQPPPASAAAACKDDNDDGDDDDAASSSLVAIVSFVLLERTTGRPAKVPPLLPQRAREKRWRDERKAIAAERKALRQQRAAAAGAAGAAATGPAAARLPPEKQQHLDAALRAAALLSDMPALSDPHAIAQAATRVGNTFITQPQSKNLHGSVFGGYLMRQAFQLAFSCAYLFAGSRPSFLSSADISFRQPVAVGSLLRLQAHVVDVDTAACESAAEVHVEVEATVSSPEARTSQHTNRFLYTFKVATPPSAPRLRRVLPTTPEDVERLVRRLEA